MNTKPRRVIKYAADKLSKMTHKQKWLKILLHYGDHPSVAKAGRYANYDKEAEAVMDLVLGGVDNYANKE